MLRFLFRMSLLAVAVGAGAYFLGYRWDGAVPPGRVAEAAAAAKAAAASVDGERVREASAEIAERVSAGAGRAEAALAEARLTAKITSKIALDDTLGDSELDVTTEGTVVTVAGTVETPAQRQRALQLARETDGVASVVDRVTVSKR